MKHLSRLFFLLACISSSVQLYGQSAECGTAIDATNIMRLQELNRTWQQYQSEGGVRSVGAMNMVPVQLHIIRTSAGLDGISVADFEAALARANESFTASQIFFYQCGAINVIDDDTYSSYDKSEMAALDAAHSVSNVINIYSAPIVTSGASSICGHAQFPGGLDFVMLANSCTNNGSTFAHELGHYFNLYHTHETFFGSELVDGTNCTTTGDILCDTPADPILSSTVDNDGCIYIGAGTDGNGDTYSPIVTNFMSYTPKECRFTVTDDQSARMLFTLTNNRAYLTCGSVVALDAAFENDVSGGCGSSLAVQFCDVSTGSPTSWAWDFGDGVGTSNSQFPSYTYTSAGTYTVSLTVSNVGGSDTETKSQLIRVGTVGVPFTEDFETGTPLANFIQTGSIKQTALVSTAAAKDGTNGLALEGPNSFASPYFQTPTAATSFDALWNPYYKTLLELCVDATSRTNLDLDFDLRQLDFITNNYTNFRVLVNGTQVGSVYQSSAAEAWQAVSIDLSAYDGTLFTLAFEGSHKYSADYNAVGAGSASFIDNIALTGDVTLPVEYADFEAKPKDLHVILDWTTRSELNNDRFEVMRSIEGNTWEKIGEIAGSGTSQALNTYQFSDWNAALLNSEKLFYQLRQVDLDGNVENSDVRSIRFEGGNAIRLFPNPTETGSVHIVLESAHDGALPVTVFNSNGQQLMHEELGTPGTSARAFALDLSILPTGLYLVKLSTPTGILVRKVRKE